MIYINIYILFHWIFHSNHIVSPGFSHDLPLLNSRFIELCIREKMHGWLTLEQHQRCIPWLKIGLINVNHQIYQLSSGRWLIDFQGLHIGSGGDWNHGIWWFSHHIGNAIIPTDELIFFRGVGQPPTRGINPRGSDVPPGNDFAVTRVRVVLKQRQQGSIAVGGLEHFFIFPNSWDDDPIWLIFFRGLKPPISRDIVSFIHYETMRNLKSW